MVHEHVDRPEGFADRLEPLPDLVDISEIGRDAEPLTRVRQICCELFDVLVGSDEQRHSTAFGRELPCKGFSESGSNAGDDCCSSHTVQYILSEQNRGDR
jgi:hypothetical protein